MLLRLMVEALTDLWSVLNWTVVGLCTGDRQLFVDHARQFKRLEAVDKNTFIDFFLKILISIKKKILFLFKIQHQN